MSDFNNQAPWGGAQAVPTDMSVDAGLRAFMLGVYNKLMLGLLVAGGLAWTVGNVRPVSELLFRFLGDRAIGYTPLGLVVAFAPIVIILFSNFFMRRTSPAASGILYWVLVAIIGASLGVLFLVYTGMQITLALAITAGAFGGLSLVGYTTKRNLTGMGSFLIMGAWGIVLAGIATFFFQGLYQNPMFFFAFNLIGVVVFGGLVAYKTQQLKLTYSYLRNDGASLAVASNFGALSLFISFVNLFQFILALLGGGGRRSS
jgi:FtsH-binding integral membrane protein